MEATSSQEEFSLLDVVAARSRGPTDAERQKLEAFEQEATKRHKKEVLEQPSSRSRPPQSSNNHRPPTTASGRTTESKDEEEGLFDSGTKDDDMFVMQVVRERQQCSKLVDETTSLEQTDLKDDLSVPQPRLARGPNVAPAVMIPGAYSAAPGTELERAAMLRWSLVGAEGELKSSFSQTLGIQKGTTAVPSSAEMDNSLPPDEHGIHSSTGLAVAKPVDEAALEDLPQAQDYSMGSETQRKTEQLEKLWKIGLLLMGVAGLVVMVILVTLLVGNKKDDKMSPTMPVPTNPSTSAPTMSLEGTIKVLLEEDTLVALENPVSPQSRAFEWLLEDPNLHSYSDARIKQKFALASLYYATSGETWWDNTSWLNHSIHECEWYNAPDFAQKMTMELIYPGYLMEIVPALETPPPHCNEDDMYQNLWLDRNNLVGYLPEELYMLTNLETMSLGWNELDGVLSTRLGQLTDLEGLVIFDQPTDGNIPSEIGLLTTLRGIALTNSNHQGVLPTELWQLTNLEYWILADHELMQGTISTEVGVFSKLKWFVLDTSDISGTIPTELGQIEPLEWIVLGRNRLSGSIPSELGFHPNKEHIHLNFNDLVGRIPSELGLLSSPYRLAFWDNHITGTVPSELGLLKNLEAALDLARNLLTGIIPTELGLLTDLHDLLLDHNQLSGHIPSEFGELTSLRITSLANNSLSGSIPVELSSLQQTLHSLLLDGNPMLTGTIPESLCHVNGTCVIPAGFAHSCSGQMGVFFGCTDLLCGCDCSCGRAGR
ncbi:Leucine Rich Repeat [Seminavis robusta]|uniref:Leucine Rich Repeat n=1 Tax=Seminavis robusta TaxID=568900 RepID=A0A9N8DE30_9STRA|nr:Leucine Rich Repeat [Seminavis robusta]|eukprot:Sro52_g030970.1 Leucine Rich Repeat (771) ;mRNA; r:62767-65162